MSLNELILDRYKPGLSIRVDSLTVDGQIKVDNYPGNTFVPITTLTILNGVGDLLAAGQTQTVDSNGGYTRIGKTITLTIPTFLIPGAKQNVAGGTIVLKGLPVPAQPRQPTYFPIVVRAGDAGATEATGSVVGMGSVEGDEIYLWEQPGRVPFVYSATNASGLSTLATVTYTGA